MWRRAAHFFMLTFTHSRRRIDEAGHNNDKITLTDLELIVRGQASLSPPPAIYRELPAMDGEQLSEAKKQLPWILCSGYCTTGHANATLQYNGCLQLDYDDKKSGQGAERSAAALASIAENKPAGIVMAAISPSGRGLKIIVSTSNTDKEKHRDTLGAAIGIFSELLGLEEAKFDRVGVSQPCYVPFDREGYPPAYFNHYAAPLDSTPANRQGGALAATNLTAPADMVREAAEYLTEKQINIASCRAEYLTITAACLHGRELEEGAAMAYTILQHSPAFLESNTARKFQQFARSLHNRPHNRPATGWTIIHHALAHGWRGDIYTESGSSYNAEAGEKMYDTLKRCDALSELHGRYIVAPTGAGKTTTICKLAEAGEKIILILPTIAAVEQTAAAHRHAEKYTGKNRIVRADGFFYVTTINSFPALATRLNLAEYAVFFDEGHELATATAANYRLQAIARAVQLLPLARSYSYMSGTPLFTHVSPLFSHLPRITITQHPSDIIPRSYQHITTNKPLDAIASGVRAAITAGRLPIVLINDKGRRLSGLIARLDGFNILTINADERESAGAVSVIREGIIPPDVQALIVTSVIQTGSSIYDRRGVDIIVAGTWHAAELAQISARPRTAAEVNIYHLGAGGEKRHTTNPLRQYTVLKRKAEQVSTSLNQLSTHLPAAEIEQLKWDATNSPIPICIGREGEGWRVDELAILHQLYLAERGAQRCPETMAAALQRYGIRTRDQLNITALPEQGEEKEKAIREKQAAREQEQGEKYYTTINAILSSPLLLAAIRAAEKTSPLIYQRVQELRALGVDVKAALNILLNTPRSGSQYKLMMRRVRQEYIDANAEKLTALDIYHAGTRALYTIGERGTATQLREKAERWMQLEPHRSFATLPAERYPNDEERRNRAWIKHLRQYFDVVPIKQAGSRCTRNWEYIIKDYPKFHVHEHQGFTCTNHVQPSPQPIVEACPF